MVNSSNVSSENQLLRSIAATLLPLVALAIQWIFWSVIQPYAWLFFFPAVFVSSWIGGLSAGLRATALSTAFVWYFFIPPVNSFAIKETRQLFPVIVFVGMGATFSIFHDRLRKAYQQAAESLALAESANRLLKKSVDDRTAELAALLDAVPAPVFIAHDPDGIHMTGNRAADQLLRLSPGAELSLSAPEETRPRHFKAVKDGRELNVEELPAQRASRGNPVHNYEFSLVFEDSVTRQMLANAAPLLDGNGRPRGAVLVMVDITKLTQVEEALRESEERFRLMIEAVEDYAIIMLDPEGNVISWNAGAERIKGYQVQEVVGRNFSMFYSSEDRERGKPQTDLTIAIRDGRTESEGWRIRKDGSSYWAHTTITALRDKNGKHRGFSKITRDVTARKRTEEARQALEEQLHSFVEQAPVALAMFDCEMNYLATSQLWMVRFGRGDTSLVGLNHYELFPDLPDRWKEVHKRGMAGETVSHEEDLWQRADGSEMWLRWVVRPWQDVHGKMGGIIIMTEEISTRKIAERELRDQKNRIRAILDTAADAIVTIDHQGIIQSVNPATERFFGYSAAEAVGQNVNLLMPSPYKEEHDSYLENYRKTGVKKIIGIGREVVARRKDGSTFPVDLAVSEISEQKLFTGIIRDISHRKQLEEQVAKVTRLANRTQRLESIGTLAGGIAHDLNNVLTPILMGAKLLGSGHPPAQQHKLLDTISASAKRGADLIRQLLAFAGGVRGASDVVQISEVVAETRVLLEHSLPKSIRLEFEVDSDLPSVLGDATELSQILMNLCVNARDAMPDGGTLTIEATSIVLNGNAGKLYPDARPGKYALLKVSDTGCGMSPEVIDRIFDPFYTTKELGKGTGLGLSTVQGIVKSHDGFIVVYSEIGNGSKFNVYLPAVGTVDSTPVELHEAILESGKGRTVLLVDDETFILQMTSAALESAGYQVLTAENGTAAIAMFSQHRSEVSAVLLDMMMPGLDALQTLDELRRMDPQIPVIACSGLRTTQRETEVLERGARAFLPKPYSEVDLLETLSKVCKANV